MVHISHDTPIARQQLHWSTMQMCVLVDNLKLNKTPGRLLVANLKLPRQLTHSCFHAPPALIILKHSIFSPTTPNTENANHHDDIAHQTTWGFPIEAI